MPNSPSAPPSLDRLGPLTDLGRAATDLRLKQDEVRRASGPPASPDEPALVPPPELDADPAVRKRAAAKHFRVGSRLLEAGKPREAIAAFRQAVLLDPDNSSAHHELGLACLRAKRVAEAISAFRQAIALKENFPYAHYHLGCALEEERDDRAAIAAYRRAVAFAPKFQEAYDRLGNLLERSAENTEAARSFEQAADAKPGSALGRLARAQALRLRGRLEEAESWFRLAVAAAPNDLYTLRAIGIFFTFAGRLDEAAGCFARCLARDPRDVLAFYNLAAARKFRPADHALLARMERLAEEPDIGDQVAEFLHFALGKAADDLGEYEAAMRHFDAANAKGADNLRFDRPAYAATVDRIVAHFGLRELAGSVSPDAELPIPILIVGTPRSGTTLVEQIVSSHPKVAPGGELGFWGQQGALWETALAEGSPPPGPEKIAGECRAVLRTISPDAPFVTDKMPINFLWLGLVRDSFPAARIIHCRRHPLDACLSMYTKRFPGSFYSRDRGSLVFFYRQYRRLMAHWRSVLPPDRFLEIDYEAVVTNREAETRRLIAFLGLPWDEACLAPEQNRRLVNTASMWQVRQPVYTSSIGRWRRYEPWLGELRELLDEAP